MLKFFRRIRRKLIDEGNLKRYLFYALGEILLVVIGILIALQINDWNTSKIERKNEELYLYRLTEDLKKDTANISSIINISKRKKEAIEYLFTIQNLKTFQEIDTARIIENLELSKSLGWSHYNVEKGTVEELRSTGNFELIQNSELKSKINNYYHSADDEYKRIDARRSNYPNEVYSLIPKSKKEDEGNMFVIREDIILKEEIIKFIKNPLFKRKLTAALNLSEFIIERERSLLIKAKDFLIELEKEIESRN